MNQSLKNSFIPEVTRNTRDNSLDMCRSLKKVKLSHDQLQSLSKNTVIVDEETIKIPKGLSLNQLCKIHGNQFQTPDQKSKSKDKDLVGTYGKEDMREPQFTTHMKQSVKRELNFETTVKKKSISKSSNPKATKDLTLNMTLSNNDRIKKGVLESMKMNESLNKLPQEVSKKNQTDCIFAKNPILVEKLHLHNIFSFKSFNAFQSSCLESIWSSGNDLLVSAPPRSGKTVLLEVALCKHLQDQRSSSVNYKAVYIAPLEALCEETFSDWKIKFGKLNLKISKLSVEKESDDLSQYFSADIIIATPAQWNAIMLKEKYLSLLRISAIMIDNLHLLNADETGSDFEAFISRLKIFYQSKSLTKDKIQKPRIIAVTDPILNIYDIGTWLGISPQNTKIFKEDDSFLKIQKHIFGYNRGSNPFHFDNDKSFPGRLIELIKKFANSQSCIIFCQNQNDAFAACDHIFKERTSNGFMKRDNYEEVMLKLSNSLENKDLLKYLQSGISFYSEGLFEKDRIIIMDLFKEGFVKILCTTHEETLGVNIEAETLIIQATGRYSQFEQTSWPELYQMIGRVKKPYDHKLSGTVIILTEKSQLEDFEKRIYHLENHLSNLESNLLENLHEFINTEISLGEIQNFSSLLTFIKGSLLYIRLNKNQKVSKLAKKYSLIAQSADDLLENIVEKTLRELHEFGLLQYNQIDKSLKSSELGMEISKQRVSFKTFKLFVQKHLNEDLKGLINILSESHEFSKIRFKFDEQENLMSMNSAIPFPLQKTVSSKTSKIIVLFQAQISRLNIEDWRLKKQSADIKSKSRAILSCFKAFYLEKNLGQGFLNCVKLLKFISMGSWEDSSLFKLMQIPGLDRKSAEILCEGQIHTIEKITSSSSSLLEAICQKNPPFGEMLLKKARQIPVLSVEFQEEGFDQLNLFIQLKSSGADFLPTKEDFKNGYYCLVADKIMNTQFIRYFPINHEIVRGLNLNFTHLERTWFPLSIFLINEMYMGLDMRFIINLEQCPINKCNYNFIATEGFEKRQVKNVKENNKVFINSTKSELEYYETKILSIQNLPKDFSLIVKEEKEGGETPDFKKLLADESMKNLYHAYQTPFTPKVKKDNVLKEKTLIKAKGIKHFTGVVNAETSRKVVPSINKSKAQEQHEQFYKLFDNIFE